MTGPLLAQMEQVASRFGVGMEQVRRDHLISHVLAAIAADVSTDDVVFFGGTALSRTVLDDARLSEDIDLIARAPRGQVAVQIEGAVRRAAAKLSAWIDRRAPRDLYDLWAMSERGLIGPGALRVFMACGPFGRPPSAWVFDRAFDEGEWMRALGHQTRLQVGSRDALTMVRDAWARHAVAAIPSSGSGPAVAMGRQFEQAQLTARVRV